MTQEQTSYNLTGWGTSSFSLWDIGRSGNVLFEKHASVGMSKTKPVAGAA